MTLTPLPSVESAASAIIPVLVETETYGHDGIVYADPVSGYDIGYGTQLNADNLKYVLAAMLDATPDQVSQATITAVTNAMGTVPNSVKGDASHVADLQSALDKALGQRFVLSEPRAESALQYIVKNITIPRLNALLINNGVSYLATTEGNNTREYVALLDMYYAGGNNFFGSDQPPRFSQVLQALSNGDRASAWFQIRYRSNGNHLPGLAQRRYYDAQLFGLFSNPSSPSQNEVLQAYQMLTENRQSILQYEAQYGVDPDSTVPPGSNNKIASANNSYALSGASQVETLAQAFAHAEPVLLSMVASQSPLLSWLTASQTLPFASPTDILLASYNHPSVDARAGDAAVTIAGQPGLSAQLSAADAAEAAANHILIGTGDGQTLVGGSGSDILVGGNGNETLIAGGGADTIVAGGGTDTVVARGIGDSIDFEVDSATQYRESVIENSPTGLDSLYVNGMQIGSGMTLNADGTWTDNQGFEYQFQALTSGVTVPTGFSPSSVDSYTGVLEVTGGALGQNKIDIWGFDLQTAVNGGFDGISIPEAIILKPGVSTRDVLTTLSNGSLSSTSLMPGQSTSFTATLLAPSASTRTITFTLTGANTSGFALDYNGQLTAFSNGSVAISIDPSAQNVTATLVNTDPASPSESLQLTATAGDAATSAALTINYTGVATQPSDTTSVITGSYDPHRGATVFVGDGQNDLINGAAGANYINAAAAGDDVIHGSSDSDTIQGGSGSDVITGGGGDDDMFLGDGNNRVYAESMTDVATALTASIPAPAHPASTLSAVNQVAEVISVGNGNNTIVAGATGAFITAGTGNNVVVLGSGNDVFTGGVSLHVSGQPLLWQYFTYPGLGLGFDASVSNFYSQGLGYLYTGTLPYHGGYANDVTIGAGNDTIFAGAGDQYIILPNGSNFVDAGSGDNNIFGGMGSDTIVGGAGNNFVHGGGDTYVSMVSGNNTIVGGIGTNTLLGGSGDDLIYSSATDIADFAGADLQSSYVDGGAGNDAIYGSAGHDSLVGGAGNDRIYAGSGNELLSGGDGNDSLVAGDGSDTLEAGNGNDSLYGGDGYATLYGGMGSDSLFAAGSGNVVMYAGGGGTALAPTSVEGGSGNSTIYGGLGVDLLQGGTSSSSATVIYVGDGQATVNAGAGSTTIYGGFGSDVIVGGSGNALIYTGGGGTAVNPTKVFAGTGSDTIVAGVGAEWVSGGSSNVTYWFDPGHGDAFIDQSSGSADLEFNVGIEPTDLTLTAAITSTGSAALEIDGDAQIVIAGGLTGAVSSISFLDPQTISLGDLIAQDGVDDTVVGATGDLLFSVEDGTRVTGGSGADTISAWGNNDTLTAGDGGDTVYAGGNNDFVYGGAGADTLIVGSGTSGAALEGGAGDTYGLSAGFGNTHIVQGDGTGTIRFGEGISIADLVVSIGLDAQGGASLIISDGTASVNVDDGLDGRISGFQSGTSGPLSFAQFLTQVQTSAAGIVVTAQDGSQVTYTLGASTSTAVLTAQTSGSNGQLLSERIYSRDATVTNEVFNTDGSAVTYIYDGAGHLTGKAVLNADGSSVDYVFNESGQTTTLTTHNVDGSTVVDSYNYNGDGSYGLSVVTTAAGATASTTVAYSYDVAGDLRGQLTTNPDGSSADYFYDGRGRVTEISSHSADGVSTIVRYAYALDGSYTQTEATTLSGQVTSIENDYDATGHLTSKSVHNPDGSSATYTYNASGKTMRIDASNADGSTTSDQYTYNADGSYSLQEVTTPSGSTASTATLYSYNADGDLTGKRVQTPDGSISIYTFDASGRTLSLVTQNADGSSALNYYEYNPDGSYTLTLDSIPANGVPGYVVLYNYDGAGILVSQVASSESSSQTGDGQGGTITNYFGPGGVATHDVWQHADGSNGTDTFYPDGSTAGIVNNADGTSDTYRNDRHGDIMTTYFDGSGLKLSDSWQRADGSHGTDTFRRDGSILGSASYADGTSSTTSNDGQGNEQTDYFGSNGLLTHDLWQHADGSHGTDIYTADGKTVTSDTWYHADGSYGRDVQQADGSWLAYQNDGYGDAQTTHYDAARSAVLTNHTESTDGTVSNKTDYSDGSSTVTWSNQNGGYGFSVYNAASGEYREFNYNSLNDWSATDEIDFADGNGIVATASNLTNGYVQLTELGGDTIYSDTNFGLDPLRGLLGSYVTDLSGTHVTAISALPEALIPYSSDVASTLGNSADPLAALDTLSEQYWNVAGLVYASQDPGKSGPLVRSADLIYYVPQEVDGDDGTTTGLLANGDVLTGGGLNTFYVANDVTGPGREGTILPAYYLQNSQPGSGSGGGDGSSGGGNGTFGGSGEGGGGLPGIAVITNTDGNLSIFDQSGHNVIVDNSYYVNSIWHG
jgi:YD repeat-containing protein